MSSRNPIASQVVESILAQKIAPGDRLGEQELADLFGVSRTLVREALMQLQARGFVEVRPRRGWFVVEPSPDEARDAFASRRLIEAGLLREAGRPLQQAVRELHRHIELEREAIQSSDTARRTFLLGDFHVCMAGCLGNRLLRDILRDLTARTTLVAMLYQSTHDATQSCEEHAEIVAALERGDTKQAEALMLDHIGHVENALSASTSSAGSVRLRESLAPVQPIRRSVA